MVTLTFEISHEHSCSAVSIGGLGLYKAIIKVFSGILGAVITLVSLSIDDRSTDNERVNLQSPSLMYASISNRYSNAGIVPDDDEEDREAEEADTEKETDPVKLGISNAYNLEDYTITAPLNFEDIADRVRQDEEGLNDEQQESYDGKFVWTKSSSVKVYEKPDPSSKVVGQLKKAAKAIRISYSGDWSYIRFSANKKGYILTKALSSKKVNTPTPTPKPVRRYTASTKSKSKSSSKSGSLRGGGFGSFIRRFVGCKYVPGGASPSGFDCSGFTMYCYRAYYGIRLPHGSNMQSSYGRKVSQSSMKVGDIIFIDHDHNGKPDHVGLYVGSGQMVHASGVKYGVICVSVKNVKDIIYVRRVR